MTILEKGIVIVTFAISVNTAITYWVWSKLYYEIRSISDLLISILKQCRNNKEDKHND